jgi:hypothetical protein
MIPGNSKQPHHHHRGRNAFVFLFVVALLGLFSYSHGPVFDYNYYNSGVVSIEKDSVGLDDDDSRSPHITHIFSSFKAPTSSPTYLEVKLVQDSWIAAANLARTRCGIEVEFLDASLDDDSLTPSFARHVSIIYKVDDVVRGVIATEGEVWKRAADSSKADLVVVTNCDIGTMSDFYIRVWSLYYNSSDDYNTIEKATQQTSLFLRDCQIAHMTTANLLNNLNPKNQDIARKLYKDILGKKFTDDDDKALSSLGMGNNQSWGNILERDFHKYDMSRSKKDFLTIVTRVDVPIEKNITLSRVLRQAAKSGRMHPGNDCFIVKKSKIPFAVQNLGHPQGVRPFGYWIPGEFRRKGLLMRRISGRSSDPWTFHVGVGLWGRTRDSWSDRAEKKPRYTLFLAANWYKLTEGAYGKEFTDTHPLCHDPRAWRDIVYCRNTDQSYCRGGTRLSCLNAETLTLRDNFFYMKTCSRLLDSSPNLMMFEPFCSFCNFLFGIEASKTKRFTCVKGIAQECNHQNCAYYTDSDKEKAPYKAKIESALDKLKG